MNKCIHQNYSSFECGDLIVHWKVSKRSKRVSSSKLQQRQVIENQSCCLIECIDQKETWFSNTISLNVYCNCCSWYSSSNTYLQLTISKCQWTTTILFMWNQNHKNKTSLSRINREWLFSFFYVPLKWWHNKAVKIIPLDIIDCSVKSMDESNIICSEVYI